MNRWVASSVRKVVTATSVLALVEALAPGCSIGDGSGTVKGTLDVPDCWSGAFNLNPNFFAADPYDSTLAIRVQNGGDYQTYSDGLSILVDNLHEIRGDAPFSPSLLGRPLKVDLPAGVAIPGAVVTPNPDPALVHVAVYLQKSCPTQLAALYALESVSVDANGNCNPVPTGPYILRCNAPDATGVLALADAGFDAHGTSDAGTGISDATVRDATVADTGAPLANEAGTVLPASPPVRHSTITFQSLFDGNEDETSAAERFTEATFEIYLADPRDACPGGLGPPPPCRGHLTGSFQFYFERGSPGQPFP